MFDEVLVNAADNYQRDKRMNLLQVEVNQEGGFISVLNNGQGIPVKIHKEYNIYVPELIFGHLLTGSNYDDTQKKVVGGRNGYGAKLTNIFSTQFIVECGDQHAGKKFKMVWTKNMYHHTEPEITKYSGKDFTSVTFYPDFKRLGMTKLDDDIFMLFTKRVYDMAGLLPRVNVVLNGKEIPVNNFLKYVTMYFEPDSTAPKIRDSEVDNERWQVVVSVSEGEFRQVSFVNGICTTLGGTHVNYIVNQVTDKI
jgi:DNA topoisomerase-2